MCLKILFVEKDVTVSDLLVPSLERKGYDVTVARTKRQATSRIRATPPDILVVDARSFGVVGLKMSESLRARLDGVLTILLVDKDHARLENPPDALMTPPFTSHKLLYRIKKVAGRVRPREAHKLRGGPLVLDPDSRTLYNGNQSVHLRPKEVLLLALFLQNPGKVLSRQELMKQVWETEYLGDTRTLSVHVRWLREKIEDDPSQPQFLRTVRGVGYRFEVPDEMAED